MTNSVQTLWNRVAVGGKGGCWNWLGGKDKDGYGKIRIFGKHQRTHRVAWESLHGPIPEGMIVLHSCDNPSCVNPRHLSVGTHLENVHDKLRKGRAPLGENNHNARLTNKEAEYMRHLYFAERQPYKALADFFEVSQFTVRQIVKGLRYRRASWQATAVI